MAERLEFVFPNPYSYAGQKSLGGIERMLGVISRANQMGYVYGKDFEIVFERGDDIVRTRNIGHLNRVRFAWNRLSSGMKVPLTQIVSFLYVGP